MSDPFLDFLNGVQTQAPSEGPLAVPSGAGQDEFAKFLQTGEPAPKTPVDLQAAANEPADVDPRLAKFLQTGQSQPGYMDLFTTGLHRGYVQTKAAIPSLKSVGQELMGDMPGAIESAKQANEIMKETTDSTWDLTKVKSPEDFLGWTVEKLGEQGVNIAAMMATGGTSGAGLALLTNRLLARGLITQATARTIVNSGVGAAAYATSTGLETAGTTQEQFDVTGTPQAGLSLAAGGVKGLLELWTPMHLLGMARAPASSLAKEIGKTMVGEGATEYAQELIDIAARKYNDPKYSFFGDGPDWWNGPGFQRALESGAAGAVVGGAYGGAAHALVGHRASGFDPVTGEPLQKPGNIQVIKGTPQTQPENAVAARPLEGEIITPVTQKELEARAQKLFGKNFKDLPPDEQTWLRATSEVNKDPGKVEQTLADIFGPRETTPKKGPVSTLRDQVLPRQVESDRPLQEALRKDPRDDVWGISPLLQDVSSQLDKNSLLDLYEANTPRYAEIQPDGRLGSHLRTDTEIELDTAMKKPQSERPRLLKVDQSNLQPAAMTATVFDLPNSGSERLWFLPNVDPAERESLTAQYHAMQSLASPSLEKAQLTSREERDKIEGLVKPIYDKLLKRGLRVIPSRGSGFYYDSAGTLSGTEVSDLSTTGRTTHVGLYDPVTRRVTTFFASKEDLATNLVAEGLGAEDIQNKLLVSIDTNKLRDSDVVFGPDNKNFILKNPLNPRALVPGILPQDLGRISTAQLYQTLYPGVQVLVEDVRPENEEMGNEIAQYAKELSPMLSKLLKELGMEDKLAIIVTDNIEQYGGQDPDTTPAFLYHDGSLIFLVPQGMKMDSWRMNVSPKIDVLTAVMHELGHIITYQHYRNLPTELQQQLIYAWDKANLSERMSSGNAISTKAETLSPEGQGNVQRTYYLTFVEWLAEQFRRWSTSDVGPHSYLTKVYSEGARELERFYKTWERNFGKQVALDLQKPDYAFTAFMDYVRNFSSRKADIQQLLKQQAILSVSDSLLQSEASLEITNQVRLAIQGMQEMFPEPVRVSLNEQLSPHLAQSSEAAAKWVPEISLIELAVGALQPESALKDSRVYLSHEIMHAYEDLGLITDKEIGILNKDIASKPDRLGSAYRAALRKRVQDFANSQNEAAKAAGRSAPWSPERVAAKHAEMLSREERAYYIQDFADTGVAQSIEARDIMTRLLAVLERIRNFIQGLGFQTREDVIRSFFKGEMAARYERTAQAKEAADRAAQHVEAMQQEGKNIKHYFEDEGKPEVHIDDQYGRRPAEVYRGGGKWGYKKQPGPKRKEKYGPARLSTETEPQQEALGPEAGEGKGPTTALTYLELVLEDAPKVLPGGSITKKKLTTAEIGLVRDIEAKAKQARDLLQAGNTAQADPLIRDMLRSAYKLQTEPGQLVAQWVRMAARKAGILQDQGPQQEALRTPKLEEPTRTWTSGNMTVQAFYDGPGSVDYKRTSNYIFYHWLDQAGNLSGVLELKNRQPKGYEIAWIQSERFGLGMQMIKEAERDLGQQMKVSGELTADGRKQAEVLLRSQGKGELIKLWQQVTVNGDPKEYWVSPNWVLEQLSYWSEIAKSQVLQEKNQVTALEARERVANYKELARALPQNIYTDGTLDQMFSLRRNYERDETQGSLQREGRQADESKLLESVGQGTAFKDAFSRTAQMQQLLSKADNARASGLPISLSAPSSMLSYEAWNIRKAYEYATGYGESALEAREIKNLKHEADRIGWFTKQALAIAQLAKINPHIIYLQKYNELQNVNIAIAQRLMRRADERARQWNEIPAGRKDSLAQAFFDLSDMNYLLPAERAVNTVRKPANWDAFLAGAKPPKGGELDRLFAKHGLKESEINLVRDVSNDFLAFLQQVEDYRKQQLTKTLSSKTAVLAQALAELQKEMNELRQKPYFPMVRFGEFTLSVRDPTQKNRVVYASAYDTQSQRKAAIEGVRKQYPGGDLIIGRVPESMSEFMGLPLPLLRAIEEDMPLATGQALTAEQKVWIEQFKMLHAPDRSFRKRWMPAKGTPGHSMDAFRTYAHYFQSGARYLARLATMTDMQQSIQAVENSITGGALGNTAKRQAIVQYMKEHFQYIMEPGRDSVKFRSFFAMYFLGFSPAAAFMNLTQIPGVLIPSLSSHFGVSNAYAQFAKVGTALKQTAGIATGNPAFQKARQEMVSQGRIDIGQAPELAAFADGYNLDQLNAGTRAQKWWRKTQHLSMVMFSATEHYNREFTFKSAWDLAMKYPNTPVLREIENNSTIEIGDLQNPARLGLSHDEAVAFLYARQMIDDTQFQYNRAQDAPFMRGKQRKDFLIFFKYMQNMLFTLRYGGAGTHMLLVMAFLYGLGGLPGADEFNELLRLLGNKLFGKDFDLKLATRRMVREATKGTIFDEVGPDVAMNGVSRYGFGLGLLPQSWGMPSFDASANGSMGRLVPGLSEFMHSQAIGGKFNESLGESAQRAAGAGYGTMISLMNFLMSDPLSADQKQWEQIFPRSVKALSKSLRYGLAEGVTNAVGFPTDFGFPQAETTRSGAKIVKFDITDPNDLTTVLTQAAGFTPTKVSETYDLMRASKEAAQVLQGRRTALYAQMDKAIRENNPEAVDDIKKAVIKYNEDVVPEYPSLAIKNVGALVAALKQRAQTRELQEQFLAPTKREVTVTDRLRDLYPGVRAQPTK